jgi:hypothetical protein
MKSIFQEVSNIEYIPAIADNFLLDYSENSVTLDMIFLFCCNRTLTYQ